MKCKLMDQGKKKLSTTPPIIDGGVGAVCFRLQFSLDKQQLISGSIMFLVVLVGCVMQGRSVDHNTVVVGSSLKAGCLLAVLETKVCHLGSIAGSDSRTTGLMQRFPYAL